MSEPSAAVAKPPKESATAAAAKEHKKAALAVAKPDTKPDSKARHRKEDSGVRSKLRVRPLSKPRSLLQIGMEPLKFLVPASHDDFERDAIELGVFDQAAAEAAAVQEN